MKNVVTIEPSFWVPVSALKGEVSVFLTNGVKITGKIARMFQDGFELIGEDGYGYYAKEHIISVLPYVDKRK